MLKASRTEAALSRRLEKARMLFRRGVRKAKVRAERQCRRHREKALSLSAKPERNLHEALRAERQLGIK